MASTYELIASQTLGSDTASVTLSSIPGTYDDLVMTLSVRGSQSSGNSDFYMRFNGDTSSVYSQRHIRGTGSSALSGSNSAQPQLYLLAISAATATASTFSSTEIYVPGYSGSNNKSVSATNLYEDNSTTAIIAGVAGLWGSSSAITSVTFFAGVGNLVTGSSFQIYGVTHA